MARINIEDSLFTKRAWMRLLMLTQDEDKALGSLVRAIIIAQRYWFPDKKKIPRDVWDEENLNNQLIECGLAVETDGGIYIRGSEDAFDWLFKKSKAGKKSGEARRQNSEGHDDTNADEHRSTPLNADEHSSTTVNDCQQPSTSSSFSSSGSSSNSNSNSSCSELSEPIPPARSEPRTPQPRGAIPEFQGDEDIESILATVKHKSQQLWLKTYPEADWIRRELLQAVSWCEANPRKRPRSDYAKFLGGWLKRGWDSYRKTLNSAPRASQAQVTSDNLIGLWRKYDDEEKQSGGVS